MLASTRRHSLEVVCDACACRQLQGRTLPKLILNVCWRKQTPFMDLCAFYVLISRVRCMDGLRLLYKDASGLAQVASKQHSEFLYGWELGYNANGRWNDSLARDALFYLRKEREEAKKALTARRKAAKAANKKRGGATARAATAVVTGRTAIQHAAKAAQPQPTAAMLRKCGRCGAFDHTARTCKKFASISKPPSSKSRKAGSDNAPQQRQATSTFQLEQQQSNFSMLQSLGLPALAQSGDAVLPPWWTSALPSLVLHARVVDYWATGNAASRHVVDYLRQLSFTVAFDTSRRQESRACAFVAARVVNDLHAAGDAWWTCDVRRAADHEWVRMGNSLLGRTAPGVVHSGFMAGGEQVQALVRSFWQNDAPSETRDDVGAWLPLPCATSLDGFLVELAKDMRAAAAHEVVPLRLRVTNTQLSTSSGLHWFTVAYRIQRMEVPERALVKTAAGKRRAVQVERSADSDSDEEPVSHGRNRRGIVRRIAICDDDEEPEECRSAGNRCRSNVRPSDESDDDDLLGDFISDDGSDWRGQVEREGVEQVFGAADPYLAQIDGGHDPGAGADGAPEDDVDLHDAPTRRRCRFVEDAAGEESAEDTSA